MKKTVMMLLGGLGLAAVILAMDSYQATAPPSGMASIATQTPLGKLQDFPTPSLTPPVYAESSQLPVLVLPTVASTGSAPVFTTPSKTPPTYGLAPVLVTPTFASPSQLATAGIVPTPRPSGPRMLP